MTENEAIEVLKDFGKQVSVKADGAYQSTIGEKACDVAIKALEENGYKYCPYCGRKIKRGGVDD